MPIVNLENLGLAGLNADTPSQTLDITQFAEGIDMRPFDGSLQGVYDFGETDEFVDGPGDTRDIYALTQWTKTGENSLNVAYLYDEDDDTENLTFQVVRKLTDNGSDLILGNNAMTPLDENARFNVDMFVFNDLIVMNDGQNHPVYLVEDNDTYTVRLLPGWPSGAVESSNEIQVGVKFVVLAKANIPLSDWNMILGTTYTSLDEIIIGTVFTAQSPILEKFIGNDLGTPVLVERIIPYNNRLVALNISDEYLGSTDYGNATYIWSTPITALNDITSLTFAVAADNSAGDDILTETSGDILDAASLGQYMIVYKSDGVYRVNDAGGPLYLQTELLFDDDGIYSPGCYADIGGGKHFVMGNYGVYLHDGGPNKEPISRGTVEKTLYAAIDNTKRDRTFMFHHSSDKEVWICYASKAHTGSGCDKAYVFNYTSNSWYERNLIPQAISETEVNGIRGIAEAELDGELFLYGWGELGPRRLGTERGFLGGGLRSNGYVEFRNLDLDDPADTKGLTAAYPASGDTFVLGIKSTDHLQDTSLDFSQGMRDYDPSTTYKLDYRITGRYYHFRLDQKDNINPKITSCGIDVKVRGKR